MADKQNGAAAAGDIPHAAQASPLKFLIANCQNFVHDQNLGGQMRSDRKSQPDVHPTRIEFDLRVQNFSTCEKATI